MGTQLLPNLAWIVCHGRTLQVTDDRVDCPLRGRVAPDLCVSCHFLETVDAERDHRFSCSIEPVGITELRLPEARSRGQGASSEVVPDLIGVF